MDLCEDVGFVMAVALVLSVRVRGLIWFAPVCSSWGFINRSASMRSPLSIMGDTTLPHVRLGNLMASRVALLIWLARARGCTWVVEQPMSSSWCAPHPQGLSPPDADLHHRVHPQVWQGGGKLVPQRAMGCCSPWRLHWTWNAHGSCSE